MSMRLGPDRRYGGLSSNERQMLYAVMLRDAERRDVARFRVGDVVDTPYGMMAIRSSYCRGSTWTRDGQPENGWRYVCRPVSAPGIKVIDGVQITPFPYEKDRCYEEWRLCQWNPNGGMREIQSLNSRLMAIVPVAEPVVVRPVFGYPFAVPDMPLLPAISQTTCDVIREFVSVVTHIDLRRPTL